MASCGTLIVAWLLFLAQGSGSNPLAAGQVGLCCGGPCLCGLQCTRQSHANAHRNALTAATPAFSPALTPALTPASSQWPKFLLFYGGLWSTNQLARPLKLAAAAALTPAVDKALVSPLAQRLVQPKHKVVLGLFVVEAVVLLAALASVALLSLTWLQGGGGTDLAGLVAAVQARQ